MSSRAAMKRWAHDTPNHLIVAAKHICQEIGREYPYFAEFNRVNGIWRLHSLHTVHRRISPHYGEMFGNSIWDVDWIERDQMYAYHMSGCGGSLRTAVAGDYWRHPDMQHLVREHHPWSINGKRRKTRRLRRIPIDLCGQQDLMQLLEQYGLQSDTYYCSVCREYLPDDSACEHVWWCDFGFWRGPGSTEEKEPCDDEDCWACSRRKTAKEGRE